MSKLTERFSELKVYNQHDFADTRDAPVWIDYRPSGKWTSSGWLVIRNGMVTDPNAHWQEHGCKFFHVFTASKAEQFEAAKQWASERYGVKEWAKTPYGAWMEADFVKERIAELKARLV